MALTLTSVKKDVWGTTRCHVWDVTFDNSYPTGGESLTGADLGLPHQVFLVVANSKGDDASYKVDYDYANELLKVSGVQQDADAAVTEPFDEEDDEADLSGLIVRVVAIGY